MKNTTKTKKTNNKTSPSTTYLVNDGTKIHTICADSLIVSGKWFIVWDWWKKADA